LLKLKKADYYFLIILFFGIILRLISFILIEIEPDTYTYIASAVNIINRNYEAYRPPGFPLLIVPLLLLTGNGSLSAKLTSFISGILLIIISYHIFSKATLKLYGDKTENKLRAKYVGLIVSFLVSTNLYFVINNARGLREDSMALILLSIYYFMIVSEKENLINNLCLAFSITFLTLTHITTGMFTAFGILLFFVISKLNFLKLNFKSKVISGRKILIILLSFGFTFIIWAIFCDYKYGNPLYILQRHNIIFQQKYGINVSSIENIIKAGLNAILFGFPSEFIYLSVLTSFVLILLVIHILIKNIRNKQILFVFFFVGINFVYLSIFMTIPRIIIYFFPFFFYLGAIPLSTIFVKLNKKEIELQRKMRSLFLIFLITYIIQGLDNLSLIYYFYQIYKIIPCFCNVETIAFQFYQPFNTFNLIFNSFIIASIEISLLIILIEAKKAKIKFGYIEN
jgi:hypothetical protein